MAWDKDKPAEGIKAKFLNDLVRENNAALEDALGRDHEFPGAMGGDAGEHLRVTFNAPLAADPTGETDKGVLYTKDVSALAELFYLREDDVVCRVDMFPSGTIMLFGQNAAPTGWTRKADWTDNSMLVYAATGDIASGGSVNAKNRHDHTGPSHTHGPGTLKFKWGYLSSNDVYIYNLAGDAGMLFEGAAASLSGSGVIVPTVAIAGTSFYTLNSASTGVTDAGGTGATGLNDQPYYQEVIAAEKD